MSRGNILYIVIPCYNEEEMLPITKEKLEEKMNLLIKKKVIDKNSRVLLVDDGSKDKTWSLIEKINTSNKMFAGLKLAHNKGHQNALLAGLMTAKEYADMVISMDADLQDDIDVIDKFIEEYESGSEIVYGVRSSRETDTKFKRMTAEGFYKIMNMIGVETVYNHADYRLMSKVVLNELEKYEEVNLFLRGIIPTIGFKTSSVNYARSERMAGESKYPLKKMLALAWQGITSFSVKPIKFVLTLGITISIVSILVLLYSLIVKLIGNAVSGWTFIVCSIWLLGGLQMLSIGLIGEYIGKIYMEVKKRPKFIIEKIILSEK